MITTRGIVLAIVTFLLGLLLGSTLTPVSLWPRSSLERDNAALREEVRLYKQMVAEYENELAEIQAVLGAKPKTAQ